MELLNLALKDLLRRKGKSLYLLLAVLIPVAILSAVLLTLDNADSSLANLASKFGFTMTIQPKNVRADRIDQIGVIIEEYIPESYIYPVMDIVKGGLGKDKSPIIVAPRLYKKADIQQEASQASQVVVAGVDFEIEKEARPAWKLTAGRWPKDAGETVAGGAYSKANRLAEGADIRINEKLFKVVGILEIYNSSEDYMIFMPFTAAQSLFEKEGFMSVINIQNIALDKNKELLKAVIGDLNRGLPNIRALSPQQFSTMKYVFLKKTFKFLFSIVVATVLVSIFSIFNIVTSVLYSRVREIGLLKSVGASRSQLFTIFFYEYAIVGFAGGIAGYLTGLFMTYLLDSFLLNIGASIKPSPYFFFIALFVGILCSLSASFYPTYKLSKIKITESFRTQWEV